MTSESEAPLQFSALPHGGATNRAIMRYKPQLVCVSLSYITFKTVSLSFIETGTRNECKHGAVLLILFQVSTYAGGEAPAPSEDIRRTNNSLCYGCNVFHGQKYVDVGCTNPEVITCTHSHKGFKHRFCIKTESTALGMVLTSGCATSRHCQQQELPGVSIHCCDSDLCNSALHCHSLQRTLLLLLVLAHMCF
ncbi:hypothetical protein G5714_005251 [Onychostoma macrolepis]|uniref:Ly6/PLAUR domain-containing protein 1-like n=1 Tax=Onychostoma macrolepis TaxID=369639 RepID=A0A7J6D0G5_9TELE|nr:hypothetical protein G5714_005251 [Onychostoma macrolepis]